MGAEEKTPVRCIALCGGAASGKTAVLVARAAELLATGVAPHDLLLVAANVDGARALRDRLLAASGPVAQKVRVLSARGLAWEVLQAPSQVGENHRHLRPLLDVEQSILVADLKAAGVDPAQLAGVVARATALWGAGENPAGSGDAAVVALVDALERRGATMPQALTCQALERVRADGILAQKLGAAYVLVDDANALSPAAAALLGALAGCELLMAGDPAWEVVLFDEGARPSAFAEVADERVELPAPAHGLGAPARYTVKWASIGEETDGAVTTVLRQVAAYVARQRSEGIEASLPDELPPYCAAQVAVVVPNKAYANAVARGLAPREVPVSTFLPRHPIGGDPRRLKSSSALAAFASLGLLANAKDAASWRTWVALGQADLASPAWVALESYAVERGMGVVEALASLGTVVDAAEDGVASDEAFAGAAQLADAYHEGRALIERYGSRRGFGLLKAVDPSGSASFAELCEPMGGEELAPEVFERLCANCCDRHYSADPACVRVGCAESLLGWSPRTVVAAGANEGLVPSVGRPQDPARFEREARGFVGALASARDELVVSYAQRCPVEMAKKLGAASRRTRRDGDEVLAVLGPSPCLGELGPDAPSTLSGQQYSSVILGVRP